MLKRETSEHQTRAFQWRKQEWALYFTGLRSTRVPEIRKNRSRGWMWVSSLIQRSQGTWYKFHLHSGTKWETERPLYSREKLSEGCTPRLCTVRRLEHMQAEVRGAELVWSSFLKRQNGDGTERRKEGEGEKCHA